MGEWAKMMFQKLADREGTEHLRIQKNVLDRQQILATAPEIWQQVTDDLVKEAEELNSMRPGLVKIKDERHLNNPSLSLSFQSRTLTVTLKGDIPKIAYTVSQSQGAQLQPLQIDKKDFTFRVIRDQVSLVGADGEIAVHDAEQILLGYFTV